MMSTSAKTDLDKELFDACCEKGIRSRANVHELLRKGANPKNLEKRIPGEFSVSPLHYAAGHGWYDIVKLFIDKYKCDPMIRDSLSQTPLHYACQSRHVDVTELLTQRSNGSLSGSGKLTCNTGTKFNVPDNEGDTPLHKACKSNSLECVRYLLQKTRCNPNISNNAGLTPIQVTSPKSSDVIRELIKHGADPNVVDKDGNTPLHKMCECMYVATECVALSDKAKCLQSVKYLLTEGKFCDPTIKNSAGLTPIQVTSLKSSDIIKELVQHGANLNEVDKDGNTLLHQACKSRDLKSVKFLLDLKQGKCDPNIQNKAGLTPIQLISPGSSDIIRELVQHGANLNEVDKDGNTLLHQACKSRDLKPVQFLLNLKQGKCDPNIRNKAGLTPIQVTSPGSSEVIKELIKHGANPNVVDKDGNTPLHKVCEYVATENPVGECVDLNSLGDKAKRARIQIVKYLLKEGKCDPNIKNKAGLTPIQVTTPGSSDIMRELVQHGADTNVIDKDGNTLLHQACKSCDLEDVKYLLKEGKPCDPNTKNNAGLTPIQLIIIVCPKLSDIMKVLVQHGANPNVIDKDGNTLLHQACKSHDPKSVKFLLDLKEGKCDPNIRNKAGLTPIQVTSPGSSDIIRELVQHGANPNAVDKDGNTLLHQACKSRDRKSVEFLLGLNEGKRDPNNKNKAGLTPILTSPGSSEIAIRELVRHGADSNMIDNDGNTPLHNTCKFEMMQSILEGEKCDPNIKNKAGLTPIQLVSPGSRDVIRELVQHGANPNVVDKDGNTLLHQACKSCDLNYIKFLLEEEKCDPNIKNKAELTPIQVTSPESSDIIRELVQHGANLNAIDSDGNTVLHKACVYGNFARLSVKFILEDGKCDPNIKNKAGLTPIQVTSPDFPNITSELIRHGASSTDAYQIFGSVLKNPKPLQPHVKVFVVGNPSTGKSTLTESLKNESIQLLGQFRKVSGVDARTAGINPHEFYSKKYGSVTFYDFAGQRTYYSSHAAVLRNSIQSPPIFIIVVDLVEKNKAIKKDLQYWLSFLSNQIRSLENKPHVIVVGSHADAVSSRGERAEQKMSRVIESLPQISDFDLVEAISLDCRYPRSGAMTKLHQCLKQSCDALRIDRTINFNAHCFFIYLLDNFGKLNAVTVKEIKTKMESNSARDAKELMAFIPTTLHSLCKILDELNDRGHILYLKDHSNDENSWVIIDKAPLLSEVTGTIFAPADFKQHCTLASSTGVVPLSDLSRHFPKHNVEMLIAFLYHLEFCREITDPEARSLIVEHHHCKNSVTEQSHAVSEFYFLFPGLIRLEAPEGIWETNTRFSHYFGWKLQTWSGQFFTTRLLQVLILRLAFSYALAPDPKDVKSDVPAFQRKCSIWKNGIFWGDQFGVETLVELLPSNDAIILLMRSYDSNLTNVLLLRSKLIQKILGVAYEFCSRVDTVELFLDPSQCNQYPLTLVNCYTIKAIAKAVTKETSHPAVVSSTGNMFPLKDLLIYEPYAGLGLSFLTDLFSDSLTERKISDDFLTTIANHIPRSHGNEIIKRLFSENTSNDDYFIALKNWRDKRNATYQDLREILNQMTIFTGRNLLKLAGVEDTELQPKQDADLPVGGVSLDLMSVTTALTDLLQWHTLGLHLGIEKVKLDEIRINYYPHGQSRQKSEMIDLWLRTDKDASWEKLCAALEQMEKFTIADKIRKNY